MTAPATTIDVAKQYAASRALWWQERASLYCRAAIDNSDDPDLGQALVTRSDRARRRCDLWKRIFNLLAGHLP